MEDKEEDDCGLERMGKQRIEDRGQKDRRQRTEDRGQTPCDPVKIAGGLAPCLRRLGILWDLTCHVLGMRCFGSQFPPRHGQVTAWPPGFNALSCGVWLYACSLAPLHACAAPHTGNGWGGMVAWHVIPGPAGA